MALESNPEMSQEEELLKNRTRAYRYLVEGNYKLIYWIESNIVFIACVFDTRQNPQKLGNMII